jgi:isocitrate/isopropylmalate dehydrogenase
MRHACGTCPPSCVLQIITRKASSRVAEFAFKYAQDNDRCESGRGEVDK